MIQIGRDFIDWMSNHISKWQIKVLFGLFAFAIVLSVVFFTQYVIDGLIDKEKRIITTYSSIYQVLTSDSFGENEQNLEGYFNLLQTISSNISFPMIMTDENDVPYYPYEQNTLNIELNPKQDIKEQRKYMQEYVYKMKSSYEPVIVKTSEGKVLAKYYYTHSSFIDILRYFPIAAFAALGGFILIGYMAFSNLRRNEESKVWVGMSKEAAHQLGTPLSSLLAWMEIIKYNVENEPYHALQTIEEMKNDVNRLSVIATRFSKIGSKPDLHLENIEDLILRVCDYFEKRLPHIGRKVEIIPVFNTTSNKIKVNVDLFTWVLENLIKNAAESIDTKNGKIEIQTTLLANNFEIIVKDNGKGMTSATRKQVFNPGFTTKSRGWGLGLSLCKRIVEQYHNGKIYVKESHLGRGTCFAIELPLTQE